MTELRAVVWAGARDSRLTCEVLQQAGFAADPCTSWRELCDGLDRGAGVLILGGELLTDDLLTALERVLDSQPPWSDLPVVLVAGREPPRPTGPRGFERLGNVAVLQRPLALETLVSSVRTALRARRRQYEVRDLLLQREEADRRREEFLAMLAHELRNPLGPIRTGVQVLRLADSVATTDRTLAMMERQVANLTRLIDDLLDVSRITRGSIRLVKQPVAVADMFAHVADSYARTAAEKGLRIDIDVPDPTLTVGADPTRLEQMVGNVVTNAIKFTPANGTIRLAAVANGAFAELRVRDSGIGIPPPMLTRVFELFAQTDRPLDRSQGGLGIGLTIVRSLAQLHGGSVQAHSDGDGTGTEIVLRLPLATPPSPAADGAARRAARLPAMPRRVLVIEDNRDAAEAIGNYLRADGHAVSFAFDGPSGIDLALRERPDAVLCDIGLPGIDGYEIARRLRSQTGFDGCLLIAVTGYGEPRDRRRGVEAGFRYYLTKPADPAEIARILAQR